MFMKQLKFLMVAFTLLMGVSFTSCLNDDAGESMYDGIGYVRTVMGSYFIDLYGNTYHPTMASVTEMEAQGFKMSGTDLAQIAFKYVEDTPATKAEGGTFTPQDYRIKLVSAIAVDSYSTRYSRKMQERFIKESAESAAPPALPSWPGESSQSPRPCWWGSSQRRPARRGQNSSASGRGACQYSPPRPPARRCWIRRREPGGRCAGDFSPPWSPGCRRWNGRALPAYFRCRGR